MQDKVQSHNNTGVLHKNQLHSCGPSIDEDFIRTEQKVAKLYIPGLE